MAMQTVCWTDVGCLVALEDGSDGGRFEGAGGGLREEICVRSGTERKRREQVLGRIGQRRGGHSVCGGRRAWRGKEEGGREGESPL